MKIVRFGFISGIGWCLDFSIFTVLVSMGTLPGVANYVSASVAVIFVFFASVRHVFERKGGFLWGKFFVYALYQTIAIAGASLAVELISTTWVLWPLLAKILVTPLTFYVNFLFMAWLIEERWRWY